MAASPLREALWDVSGAALNSREDTTYAPTGRLGVAYTVNADTRFSDILCLGPAITTIDCGAAGGTAADTTDFATSGTMNATVYLYAARGTKWAKIQLSNATLISDGSETATAEAVTGLIYAKSADSTQTISVLMDNTVYRNITTVSGGATDTHSAHASEKIRVARIVGGTATEPKVLGAQGQTLKQIVLSGSVTMASDVWTDIAIIPDNITPTSIIMDGPFIILNTNKGPYFLEQDSRSFRPLLESVGSNSENGRAAAIYSFLGVLINLQTGTRYLKNVDQGGSVGPETYLQNDTPIKGRMTAFCFTERWGYMAVYDPLTDDTYLCAVRPRQAGDWHTTILSYYPIAKFTDTNCNALIFTDIEGGRSQPTIFGGYNDDVFHMAVGTIDREIDDTGYTFAQSGSWYGTVMTRTPNRFKRIAAIQVRTVNCSATETVTVSVSVDGGAAQQIGYTITSDGIHTMEVPVGGELEGQEIQPIITLAGGGSTATPRVKGKLRMFYRDIPLRDVNGKVFEEVQ
jgi:hypothetical protein